jgi:NhaP-type Na+/H+ or K+/H+ antiporter
VDQSRFTRTPTWAIIVTELAVGLVLIIFAAANAADIDRTTDALLSVGMGTVGGMAIGLAAGMTRHRLSARAPVERPD